MLADKLFLYKTAKGTGLIGKKSAVKNPIPKTAVKLPNNKLNSTGKTEGNKSTIIKETTPTNPGTSGSARQALPPTKADTKTVDLKGVKGSQTTTTGGKD